MLYLAMLEFGLSKLRGQRRLFVVPPAFFIAAQHIFLAVLCISTHIYANWIAATAALAKTPFLFDGASQKLSFHERCRFLSRRRWALVGTNTCNPPQLPGSGSAPFRRLSHQQAAVASRCESNEPATACYSALFIQIGENSMSPCGYP